MKPSSTPQRELSSTTSRRSATAKKQQPSSTASHLQISDSVQYIKGVGPKLSSLLNLNGIFSIKDLLYFFPRDYQDRSRILPIGQAMVSDQPLLLQGRIVSFRFIPIRNLARPILEAKLTDGSGSISLKWFAYNRNFFLKRLQENPEVLAYGTLRQYQGRLEMLHPELEFLANEGGAEDQTTSTGQGIVPIYVEHEGLNQKLMRKLIGNALEAIAPQLHDPLPSEMREKYRLSEWVASLKEIHRPQFTAMDDLKSYSSSAQRRIIFEDFFKFQFAMGMRRKQVRQKKVDAFPFTRGSPLFLEFEKSLPFTLTHDQTTALDRIYQDLALVHPMNRLLQGDVGCGKTLVALGSSLAATAHGAQTALLAPTEILAQQHYLGAKNLFEKISPTALDRALPLRVEILVGSTSKLKRFELLADLQDGKIDLLIGTHALIEPDVHFHKLGLVIIDEQHRFGVDQRATLRGKGKGFAHLLSMTATPIPRTLALTVYGDLDVTVIREMPKGRIPISTKIIPPHERDQMFSFIQEELKNGRQAYIIFPLVEESEKIDLANAVDGAEALAHGPFRNFRVGLLHGRMKPVEKNDVMTQFKEGKIQVLVSTTVIEVGVDVPNATVLLMEHSERFGLSQLHQLRGRVGRGIHQSHCFLAIQEARAQGVTSPPQKSVAMERLRAMEETHDGFRLAELDLKIRGPGEFTGTRQAGELNFPMADLARDQEILSQARTAAFEVLTQDPQLELEKNAPLRVLFSGKDGQALFQRLGSG